MDFKTISMILNGLRTGSISIGGTNLFVSFLLPPLLSRFTASYPAVEIQLAEASTEELTEKTLCRAAGSHH